VQCAAVNSRENGSNFQQKENMHNVMLLLSVVIMC